MCLFGVQGQAAIARSPSAPALAAPIGRRRYATAGRLDNDEGLEQHPARLGLHRVLVDGRQVIAEAHSSSSPIRSASSTSSPHRLHVTMSDGAGEERDRLIVRL